MNTHNLVANCQFGNVQQPYCHQVSQVAFRAEFTSGPVPAAWVGWEEVNWFIRTCSMYADAMLYHFCKEGSGMWGFDEA